jgi:anti-sigma factor RsiW
LIMRQNEKELDRYVDKELDPRSAEKVEARLRSDPMARSTVARLRAQGQLLRGLADTQADEASLGVIWARVEDGLKKAPAPTLGERLANLARRFAARAAWVTGGVTVAAAAAVMVFMLRQKGGANTTHLASLPPTNEPAAAQPPAMVADIQNIEFDGSFGTVLNVPDNEGHEATIVLVTAQTETPKSPSTPHPAAPAHDTQRRKL